MCKNKCYQRFCTIGSKTLGLVSRKNVGLKSEKGTGFSIDLAILALPGRPSRNLSHSLAPSGEGPLWLMDVAPRICESVW